MAPTLPPITLLEPLSLLGRELLQVMDERDLRPGRLHVFHLRDDDEHQVAEIAGSAGIVPPLPADEPLPGGAVTVIAGPPAPGRRELLARLLGEDESLAVLDMAGTGLVERPVLAGAPDEKLWPPRAVVASPGAAVVHAVAAPLLDLGVEGVWAAVGVPASAEGRDRVEAVARQAAARLQGTPPVPEDGPSVAFDRILRGPGRTADEVAALLPGVSTTVTETLTGVFHGWAVDLGLRFASPIREDALRARWEASGVVDLAGEGLSLTSVVESDRVHVGSLVLAPDGRQAALTAFADGLRVGGATTALEILPALV